jgi:DNA-binding transcriptional regulator YhcF (GntR family)
LHITKLAGLGDTEHVAELGDWVRVDPQAAKPLFDQLRTQIIDGIRDGRLSPGTRLPTVRELAGKMSLAVNTVARAYRELESAGVLETRGRFGTFVARVDPADTAMATAAHTYASAARALGIDKAEAMRYVETAFG